jgi:4-hydroxymandelate oxidase
MSSPALLSLDDYEKECQRLLPRAIWTYLAGGAGRETTISANLDAFRRWRLCGTPLESQVTEPEIGVSILGREMSVPIILAPTSPQRLFHPDAELASIAGAHSAGCTCIVSTDSHYSLREIGRYSDFWFQLYCYGDRSTTATCLRIAEDAGATAIVVTVDNNHEARRISMQRCGFACPDDVEFGILREIGYSDGSVPNNARLPRRTVNWGELDFIRSVTSLPLLVKGILRASDARRLIDCGATALIVSNHGGRQLDDSLASLDAMISVVSEIDGAIPILMDGGVRSGLDVIKAIALGADAVCIGRPYVWGMTISGASGVHNVIELMKEELLDGMRQLGLGSLSALSRDLVIPASR